MLRSSCDIPVKSVLGDNALTQRRALTKVSTLNCMMTVGILRIPPPVAWSMPPGVAGAACRLCGLAAFPSASVAGPTVLYSFAAPTSPHGFARDKQRRAGPGVQIGSGQRRISVWHHSAWRRQRRGLRLSASTTAGNLSNLYSFQLPSSGQTIRTRPITIWGQMIWCRELTEISTAPPGAAAPISPARFS